MTDKLQTLQFATFDSVGVPIKVTKKDYITTTEDSGRVVDRVIVYYE